MAKILVIDDEVLLREEVLESLEFAGFDVVGAENGQEGINLAHIQQPDLILCDVMMPEVDGYQVLSKLRQHPRTMQIPFIFMTAKDGHGDLRQGMSLGADDYLKKPLKVNDLLDAVAARLARQQNILSAQQYLPPRDSSTQLPNKQQLINQLNGLVDQAKINPVYQYAILCLGVDRFKKIRDAFGPLIGKQLIQKVAMEVQPFLHPEHFLAYFGGDEFIVLLQGEQSDLKAQELANRIYHWSLTHKFELETCEVFSRFSIGISCSQSGYNDAVDVIADAALAMHYARDQYDLAVSRIKKSEHDFSIFTPQMRTSLSDQVQLESDLRRAILEGTYSGKQQEFCLYYQPIINLRTNCLVGFETLIRWNHPQRGLVPPDKFISITEATGLINELGWWIIQEACNQLRDWKKQFPHCRDLVLNINISPVQLKQTNFIQHLVKILDVASLTGKSIKLEVTESCLLEVTEQENNMLDSLGSLDIKLCIDDFGKGYSNLSRLHELPIDTLKIDRSFVNQINEGNQHPIIQTIITLANTMNIHLVAEGVETHLQLDTLQQLDCEMGQGYLFSKPLPSHAAEQLLIALGPQLQFSL